MISTEWRITKTTEETMTDLLEVFKDFNPQKMTNGQIRMECPFRENHPDGSGRMSFFVSPDKNAFHCFSCGTHGNLVHLLTTKFGVNYFEAVEMVNLVDYHPEEKEFELDLMWDVNNPPQEFLKRGLRRDTLKHFRVGMMDKEWFVIPYYKDFSNPDTLLGYQRRCYYPDRKVRNSKGFDKKNYLYNLDFSYNYVVVVEGQTDVMRLYQHGYNATGIMGADLSNWQAEQLGKFDKVYLALDNDTAGRKATEICYHLLKNHTEVLLVPYLSKDPEKCISPKVWSRAFNNSTDYLQYSMEMTMNWDSYLDLCTEVQKELEARND